MTTNADKEDNVRIIGILAIVFCIIPIIGLILGIIATQKGRNGKSAFAVRAGWIGIILSLILAGVFSYWRYETIVKEKRYQECVKRADILPTPVLSDNPQLVMLDKDYQDNYYKPGGGRDTAISFCNQ